MKVCRPSRRAFLHASGAAALVAGVGLPARVMAAGIELKLAHQLGPDHPSYQAAELFANGVSKRTNGEVKITIFPHGALGSPPDMVRQAQQGAIDLVMFNPPNIESQDRAAGVIQIPYQFDSYEHAHRTLDETAKDWLNELMLRNKLTRVSTFEYGFRALSNSKRPVLTPDDVAGLKLRVPPELSIKATFEALGANTQTIPFNELYLALASKTVDGQDNPVAVDYANKFYEVQNHVATTHHIYTSFMLTASTAKWNGLSSDIRAILVEEGVAAGKVAQKEVQNGEEKMLGLMEKEGVQITRPEPGPFREMMGPAYKQLRARIGDDNWDQWSKFVDAARAS